MKNFIQPGKVIDAPAPSGGVVSGTPYVIGSFIGVAQATAAEGVNVGFALEGVFQFPKATGAAWAVGDKIYWTGSVCNKTASGNTLIGICVAAAVSGDAVGKVKLGATTV